MAYADPAKKIEWARKKRATWTPEQRRAVYDRTNRDRREKYHTDAEWRGALVEKSRAVYEKKTPAEVADVIARLDARESSRTKEQWLGDAVSAARTRAKKAGTPFAITKADIVVPDTCPVLGYALQFHRTKGKRPRNLATLDKVNPAKGYVPGNVVVMSHRANRLKDNATLAEAKAIASFMEAFLG